MQKHINFQFPLSSFHLPASRPYEAVEGRGKLVKVSCIVWHGFWHLFGQFSLSDFFSSADFLLPFLSSKKIVVCVPSTYYFVHNFWSKIVIIFVRTLTLGHIFDCPISFLPTLITWRFFVDISPQQNSPLTFLSHFPQLLTIFT